MQWIYRFTERLRALWRGNSVHRDIDDELQFHIDMRAEEFVEQGMSSDEARKRAERMFGNTGRIMDTSWDVRGGGFAETLLKDLRFGLRMLARRPGFAFAAVLSLALGIGACTAIFSVVDGVLLRPLPYPEPDRIVQVLEVSAKGHTMAMTDPNFADVRRTSRNLESAAAYGGDLESVTGGSEPVRTYTYAVSSDFFRVLGIQPVVGRAFLPEESKLDANPVAVVSYGFWQRLLGGNIDLTKSALHLNHQTFTVVGVMPQGFDFPHSAEIWIPSELYPPVDSRSAHNSRAIARLRSGVSLDQARTEVSSTAKQLKQQYGSEMDAVDMTLIPLKEYQVGSVRPVLLILLGAVSLLLLIACANVANLLLAQATARTKELAIRAALGATRFRLARQFVTEAILLTLIAAAFGVILSFWGVGALVAMNQSSVPHSSGIGVNSRALIFTVLLSFLVAILLGLIPAFRVSGINLNNNLKESTRGGSAGAGGSRLRSTFVVAQIGLTLVLLIGAGLLGKSFFELLRVDPGFNRQSAVAMDISYPFPENESQMRQMSQLYQQLLERVEQIPGVTSVGGINALPMTDSGADGTFSLYNDSTKTGYAEFRVASQGYFKAMGIPLMRGRFFDTSDGIDAPQVALISQTLSRKVWSNEDPLGKQIQFGNMDGDQHPLTIVGIVGDVREDGLERDVSSTVYVNSSQRPRKAYNFSVVIRTSTDPVGLVSAARSEARRLNRDLPVTFRTIEEVFSSSLDGRRFSLVLFGVFASVALLLAITGIYGVISYSVAQRTQEISIRMALGARARDVLRLVISGGMKLTLVGIAIGLIAAYLLTRIMVGLLYGVSAADPATYAGVSAVMVGVAFFACLIPAHRATRVDPITALKQE